MYLHCVYQTGKTAGHLVICDQKAEYIYEGYSVCYDHYLKLSAEYPDESVDTRHRYRRTARLRGRS